MICRLCQTNQVTHTRGPKFDVCDQCATRLGVFELGAPTRPARPCDRCTGMQFVRVVPRVKSAYQYESGSTYHADAYVEPFAATFMPRVDVGFLGGRHVKEPHGEDFAARGIFEAYICVNCGFVEWYCLAPRTIPLGPEHMADYIDYAAEKPSP